MSFSVSRMPAYAVSRNSPLIWSVTVFLQRMLENGLLGRFQHWTDWFVRRKTGTTDESVVINIFNVWIIARIFFTCTIVQCLVFIGDLVFYRWQMRRN